MCGIPKRFCGQGRLKYYCKCVFFVFQPEDILKLCFSFKSQPVYAHKRHAYKKEDNC